MDKSPQDASALKLHDQSPALRTFLIQAYENLRVRLASRLGSLDAAEEALQDTYVRLVGTQITGEIRNPGAYLFRAAFNIALNRRRDETRRLGKVEIDVLLHVADDAPDALSIAESRSDLTRLKAIMAELPPRARAILLAVRLDGLSQREVADRFGISVSMVEKELRKAQEYCAARFGRKKR